MLKVLIADDEVHICSLLKYLIDWEKLGLEFAGSFGNGQAVLDHLRTHTADILLCDIEMPGLNGIELMQQLSRDYPELKIIVISGFRSFDYVRSSMQLGACNYLLKPVNEVELNQILSAVVAQIRDGSAVRNSVTMQASARLQFFDLLHRAALPQTLEEINRNFGYRFLPGTFQVLYAVFPGLETDTEKLRLTSRTLEDTLRPMVADLCQELEFFREDEHHLCILLNTAEVNSVNISIALDAILHNLFVELSCKCQDDVFVGVGVPAPSVAALSQSYRTAQRATYMRFFAAHRKSAYADERYLKDYTDPLLSIADRQTITHCIEDIDPDRLEQFIQQAVAQHGKLFAERPYLLYKLGEEFLQQLLHTLANLNNPLPNPTDFFQKSLQRLDLCTTLPRWQTELCRQLNAQVQEKLTTKLDNVAAYSQQAKQYIDRHYQENITLEKLATQLGINAAYLSVVFKNDLQMNYSKYLLMMRMEKAKELLRCCEWNLTEIAHAVGYDRTAYFSSAFRTYTGLHPKEYQRLHQSGLGDGQ